MRMNDIFLVLLMIFFHIVADYNLQGWLASAKQKSYWKENAPEPMYAYDYICALLTHGFAWAFMVMLPIVIDMSFAVGGDFAIMLVLNTLIHAIIDHMKANERIINLCIDQLLHMLQIAMVAGWYLRTVKL